jgi:hypothetical protein
MTLPNPLHCSSCGARLEPDALFCEECGAAKVTTPAPAAIPTSPLPPYPINPPPPSPVYAAQLPAAKPGRNPLRLLLLLGCGLISCVLLMVSLISLLGIFGGVNAISPYLPPSISSLLSPNSQTVDQSPTQAATSVPDTNTQIPVAPRETPVPNLQNVNLITEAMLPNLILSASDIPTGWTIEESSTSGISNEAYANKNMDDPTAILKILNAGGRITDIAYYYTAPGDACANTSGPLYFILSIDLLKNADGATKYYEWQSFEGKNEPLVGERSLYNVTMQNSNWKSCNAKYTVYLLLYQRLNTNVFIRMIALTGSLPDSAAEKLLLDYGKKVDEKIISQVQ